MLLPWASRRRQDLLDVLDRLNPTIDELSMAVEQEAKKRPEVLRLMTYPGVGPLTALAFVLVIGSTKRFACGKQIGSYLGLIPCEDSSANRQRLGHISKQGNTLLRFLLVEAAQARERLGRSTSTDPALAHIPNGQSMSKACQQTCPLPRNCCFWGRD